MAYAELGGSCVEEELFIEKTSIVKKRYYQIDRSKAALHAVFSPHPESSLSKTGRTSNSAHNMRIE
jgi:hypothetical protein